MSDVEEPPESNIDSITGLSYAKRADAKVTSLKALPCPFPHLEGLKFSSNVNFCEGSSALSTGKCDYVFSRAYDIRRHLHAAHGVDTEKESVEQWVKEQKLRKA
jgi:uncharacterized C2H2 Zn-finger protein